MPLHTAHQFREPGYVLSGVRRIVPHIVILAVMVGATGCGELKNYGGPGQPCFSDDTCRPGLECREDRCITMQSDVDAKETQETGEDLEVNGDPEPDDAADPDEEVAFDGEETPENADNEEEEADAEDATEEEPTDAERCLATTGSCWIDETCYAYNDENPDNDRQVCIGWMASYDWTTAAKGSRCDDADPCTDNDRCADDALCKGNTYSCNDHGDCDGEGGCA